jgi:hypothetical protein
MHRDGGDGWEVGAKASSIRTEKTLRQEKNVRKTVLATLAMAMLPFCAFAVDGVVLINQSSALAGNVTPGDTAGFPVTISVSGSYRLSGNLTVPDANTTAIKVTADNVTIDLNGFSILGPVVCVGTPVTSCMPTGGTGLGVDGGSIRNTTVVNGSVRGMGNGGILLGAGAYVEKVHVESNNDGGVSFTSGMAIGNTIIANGGNGITSGFSGNVVSGNTINFNQLFGIQFVCPSVAIGNVVMSNAQGNFFVGVGGPPNCQIVNNAP